MRVLYVFVLMLPSLPAQENTFKVTTRSVQVSVVVHDKHGDPVADLTKDDFILYDKGQPQEIRSFRKEVSAPPTKLAASNGGFLSNRDVSANMYGNPVAETLPNSLTVVLLDGLNTRFTDQYRAKQALIDFLKQIHPGDQVAIYTLTNELRVLHDFTSDTASLLTALNRNRNRESMSAAASTYLDSSLPDLPGNQLNNLIDDGNSKTASYNKARRSEVTVLALWAIANHLAGLRGRKNLIWLSGDFPVVAAGINGVLNDVGVAVYPIDARGLIGMNGWMPSNDAATPSSVNPREKPMDRRAQMDINDSHATMLMLADRTGGRACLNNNDIAGCVRRAMEDAQLTYVLSYTPSHNEWDGKFREIRIKLNRPDLEARYRAGYYASPDPPSDQKTRRTLLADAGMSPLAATGLTVNAKFVRQPHPQLSVVLDGNEISFGRDAHGQPEATVDMRVLVFGDDPKPLTQTGHTGHLVLKPEQFDQLMKDGIPIAFDVETPTKARRIRIVVRDAASGRVGSLDLPL